MSCRFPCLSAYLHFAPVRLPFILACLLSCLSVCPPVCLPVVPICLPSCLSACLPVFMHARLVCLHVYLSACPYVCLLLSAFLPFYQSAWRNQTNGNRHTSVFLSQSVPGTVIRTRWESEIGIRKFVRYNRSSIIDDCWINKHARVWWRVNISVSGHVPAEMLVWLVPGTCAQPVSPGLLVQL